MTKRFLILDTSDYLEIQHEFVLDSREKAISAFRTLYGEQPQYVLFEQVACSEPTGSRDEADDSSGQTRLHAPL